MKWPKYLLLLLLTGCSSMLPMTEKVWDVTPGQKARLKAVLGDDVSDEALENPKIDYSFEVKVPCMEMLRLCYPSMPWYMKALGSIPLACTTYYQHAWRDESGKVVETAKTAIAYSCWATPGIAMDHEREHLEGHTHKWW